MSGVYGIREGVAPSRFVRRGLIAGAAALLGGTLARVLTKPVHADRGNDWELGQNNQNNTADATTFLIATVPNHPAVEVHNNGASIFGGTGIRAVGTGQWHGVAGEADEGAGVAGASQAGSGVVGTSRGKSAAVFGRSDTGDGVGVLGESGPGGSGAQAGVQGFSGSGPGVQGTAKTLGVSGKATSGSDHFTGIGMGVQGEAIGGGAGVFGRGGTYGVFGQGAATGVQGLSLEPGGNGLNGYSDKGIAVFGVAGPTAKAAGQFEGAVIVNGDFTVGVGFNKSVAVKLADGTPHRMFCLESPESWFQDFGEATLVHGRVEVQIPADFAQVVDLTRKYFVFVTPNDGKIKQLGVTSRLPDRFVVEDPVGNADGTFSYVIAGHRRDVVPARLPRLDLPEPPPAPSVPSVPSTGTPNASSGR